MFQQKLMVGDTIDDIIAAKEAGIPSVGVTTIDSESKAFVQGWSIISNLNFTKFYSN